MDDSCNFNIADLKPNPQFDFTLLCRMCWSKNVMEERDAPDQILLGSMDEHHCVLLGLVAFLEYSIATGDGADIDLLFSVRGIDDPAHLNALASNFLRDEIFNNLEFVRVLVGLLGSHSIRKYSSTRARRNGRSKDDCD